MAARADIREHFTWVRTADAVERRLMTLRDSAASEQQAISSAGEGAWGGVQRRPPD